MPQPTTSPAQAAKITAAYVMSLSGVDSSGRGTLSCSHPVGESYQRADMRIDLLAGKLLPPAQATSVTGAPSDRYTLERESGAESPIVIKTKQGRQVGRITSRDALSLPGDEDCPAMWSPTDEIFAFMAQMPATTDMELCTYSIKERKVRHVLKNTYGSPVWSSDGRYLTCITEYTGPQKPGRTSYDRGVINVLDARHGFRSVLRTGILAYGPRFSPSNAQVAFTDRAKDEYGDLDNYVLQVADLTAGKVRTIAVSRRSIRFAWAGDHALAVQTRDKYARPSICITSVDGKRTIPLASEPDFQSLEPVAYVPRTGRVVYIAHRGGSSDDRPMELWAAEPGRKPIRLFPLRVRAER